MNTGTQLPRRSFSPHTWIGAIGMVVLFGLASVAAAYADPPVIRVVASRNAKVSLADLDLTTPAGARVAYERIRRVAERLCHDPEDPWSRYHAATYNACVRETVADALHQIQAPAIAALEK
jgi:UrcA family protein